MFVSPLRLFALTQFALLLLIDANILLFDLRSPARTERVHIFLHLRAFLWFKSPF